MPDFTLTGEGLKCLKALANVDNTLTLFGGSDLIWTNNKANTIYYQTRLGVQIPDGEHSFHDLRHFLSYVGLFQNPVLVFEHGVVLVTDETGRQGKYGLSERKYSNTIEKPVDLPSHGVTIPVSKSLFADWKKASKVVGTELSTITDRGLVQTRRGKEDSYRINLEFETSNKFEVNIQTETLDQIEPDDYRVDINFDHMIVRFTAPDGSYYIVPANRKKSSVEPL